MISRHISSFDDIKCLVDSFYEKVRTDSLLRGIFQEVIQEQWPEHLQKMYRFWQTVLLNEHSYTGSPFAPHARLPIGKKHFSRWLQLFTETVDEHFIGDKAEEAKWRAQKMAQMFYRKIQYFQNHGQRLIL